MIRITERLSPTHAFLGVVGALFCLRLFLALSWDGYFGVDGGAYAVGLAELLSGQRYLPSFPRPPLAPGLLLWPFVELFGLDVGYKIWSALFSILPLFPVYLLTKKHVGAWPAVFGAGFLALDWFHSEMTVTGALPLIGFFLIAMCWWLMAELSERFNWRYAITLSACIALIPWINQTSAGLAIIVLPAYWLALFAFQKRWIDRSDVCWNILPFAFLGGIAAAAALPWYMQTLPGSSLLRFDGPMFYLAGWWPSWVQAGMAWSLGGYILWRNRNNSGLQTLAVAAILLGFLLLWMSYDEVLINPPYRARYLLAVAFYPLITWVVFNVWLPKWRRFMNWPGWATPMAIGFTVLAVVYMGTLSVWSFQRQATLSAMITPASERALATVPGGMGVATNSFTMSLWVAALKRHDSPHIYTAPPPPAYRKMDEQMRCILGWVPGCDVRQSQEALNVEYILIDERFPDLNAASPPNYKAPPDQWAVTANTPWLELDYSEGTTRLWRIENAERVSR